MKEYKIEESVIISPTDGSDPESNHIAQAIRVLQYPAGNQTLEQYNGGFQHDAVTIQPDQLLTIIRKSEYILKEAKDAYVKTIEEHLSKYEDMVKERLAIAKDQKVIEYLNDKIEYSRIQRSKISNQFYSPRADLFEAVCAALYSTFNLLAQAEDYNDDAALAKKIEEAQLTPAQMAAIANIGQ